MNASIRMSTLNSIVVILLSAWLGVTLFVWWSATGTFEVLSAKKNPELAEKLNPIPKQRQAALLRHAAGEVNRRLFRGWNAAQFAFAIVILGACLFRLREGGILFLLLSGILFAVVLAHLIWLGPAIEAGGRALEFSERSPESEAARQFAFVHGVYVISDMAKAGFLGGILWLAFRRRI